MCCLSKRQSKNFLKSWIYYNNEHEKVREKLLSVVNVQSLARFVVLKSIIEIFNLLESTQKSKQKIIIVKIQTLSPATIG